MASRHHHHHKKHDSIQHQVILDQLLQDEANKTCADCWARNPRWASWNLGIFLCIRCAGIHRNLGVHISRVKSIGLDSWTDEQVASMQNMGNAGAAIVYEVRFNLVRLVYVNTTIIIGFHLQATLPESLRYSRPASDQALEKFIRDKYDRKLYYDKAAASSRRTTQQTEETQHSVVSHSDIPAAKKSTVEELPHPDGKPLIEF